MSVLKLTAVGLAGLLAVSSAHAAALVAPAAKPVVVDVVDQAKKKKKKRDVAGKCGTFKFFDKKKKACVDARDKR